MWAECQETVSILNALVFGANGACVRIDIWSLLSAFAVFMGIVIILQWGARRVFARPHRPVVNQAPEPEPANQKPYQDDPNYRDSAIRSSRR